MFPMYLSDVPPAEAESRLRRIFVGKECDYDVYGITLDESSSGSEELYQVQELLFSDCRSFVKHYFESTPQPVECKEMN